VNASLITGLSAPRGIFVDGSTLYVSEYSGGVVGKYTTSGAVVNASFISGLNYPTGIAVAGSDLFVVNSGDNHHVGTVGVYNATSGATVNSSLLTGFYYPFGIAVDQSNIFVADYTAGVIGKYSAGGATVDAAFISGLSGPIGLALVAIPEPTTTGAIFAIMAIAMAIAQRRRTAVRT
jgi:hypothetical protein